MIRLPCRILLDHDLQIETWRWWSQRPKASSRFDSKDNLARLNPSNYLIRETHGVHHILYT